MWAIFGTVATLQSRTNESSLTSEARCLGAPGGTADPITIAFLACVPLHGLIFGGWRQRRASWARRVRSERFTARAAGSRRRAVSRAEKQALEFGELLSVK